MRISRIPKYIADIIDNKRRGRLERWAHKKVVENKVLYNALNEYLQRAKASGAAYFDYWMLYTYIRTHKPTEILECGTGVTTVVMACALSQNEEEEGVKAGRITSMEEYEEYHNDAISCFPQHLKKYVDFIHSPKVDDYYHLFRGVRYRDVPEDREYDFVYVDGPTTRSLSDNQKTFDFDFVRVVERSEKPVFAFVDTRMSTCWALERLLKEGNVKFDYANQVGLVGPCTKNDLQPHTNNIIATLGPRPLKGGSVFKILN